MSAEDYRPRSWDGVVGQPVDEIQRLIDGAYTPNFLFYGPAATGKTTVAYLIAREIQGSVAELMEFNASDERGIDVIRDKIIPVVDQTTLSGAPRVIFLDEMESMTPEAQEALRQPMEQGKAIFVLACNEVDRVIDPLRSRCYDYEFGPVDAASIKERVQQLGEREGVDLSDDDLNSVASYADGDMRKAIQRYTQLARGIYSEERERTPTSDGVNMERAARDFLDGDT